MNWRVLVCASLLPALVSAQEVPQLAVVTYPPGEDKIVVLRKGDPAPFVGQLFDEDTALRWALWLKQYKGRYALDMQAAQDSCKAKLDYSAQVAKIVSDRDQAVSADLMKRLKDSEVARLQLENDVNHPTFFKEPAFWFGVGVVMSLVTVAVTAETLHKVGGS